ncbi:hypothetical protein CU318_03195 [Acinetobacter pseudolwoffii]|nr:hypothetical protein CU318_03195 [Acinetobacter pseudolwoffii]
MTSELLLIIIQASIGIFALVIVIMLIYPKWRKKITEPKGDTSKCQRGSNWADGLEFIFYPIYWLIKIIIAIFK